MLKGDGGFNSKWSVKSRILLNFRVYIDFPVFSPNQPFLVPT